MLLSHSKSRLKFHFRSQERDSTSSWLWRQCGAAIVIEGVQDKGLSSRYIGRFDGEVIRGEATNPSGKTWTWEGALVNGPSAQILCDHDPIS